MRQLLGALICGWLLAPHGAEAKDKPSASARLELTHGPGSEQCQDLHTLARAVEARLQRRVFRADVPATLYVNVALTREGVGWSALLTLHDGSGAFLGRRSLVTEAGDCSALDESLALVVALLVDSPPVPEPTEQPLAPTARAAAQASSPHSAEKPTQSREMSPIRLPRDTPAPRAPWRLQLAAEGIAALGILPGFAPGFELGFGAKAPTLPEFRLFAGWYAQREQTTSAGDAGARFDLGYLGLEICPLEQEFGSSAWFLCGGQSVGRLRVAAFGFDENETSTHLSYALLLRSGVQLALGSRWAARVGIRAELPLTRGVFSYGTPEGAQQELFQASHVAAVLDLGIVVRL